MLKGDWSKRMAELVQSENDDLTFHREISVSVRDARCLRLMGRLAWHTVAEIGTMPNAIGKSSLDAERHQQD